MVGCTIFFQKFWSAISSVVRVGKAKINEEGIFVGLGLAFIEKVDDLVAMPRASRLGGASSLVRVVADFKKRVGSLVAVSSLASSHGVIS